MKMREESVMRGRSLKVAAVIVSVAAIALSGCYIFSPSQAQENRLQTQLHFNLAQCEQISAVWSLLRSPPNSGTRTADDHNEAEWSIASGR